VKYLVIGPSQVKDMEKLRELRSCAVNSRAELREVGVMLRKGKEIVQGIEEELVRIREQLTEEKGCGFEWKWI